MIEQTLLDKFNSYKTKRSQRNMAKEYGFDSAESFKVHLEQKIQEAGNESKPEENKETLIPVIRNVHIVDSSGSMFGRKINSAIKGVNTELEALQKDNTVEYTQTLVEFSHKMYYCEKEVPIKEAKKLKINASGSTALYSTVGTVLEHLMYTYVEGTKTLVKIFTDGGENSSIGKYKDPLVLRDLIKDCEENYEFTITFVGTELDIEDVIRDIGIQDSNTLSHDNTARGIETAYTETIRSTKSYSKKVKKGENVTRAFYKKIIKNK